jgi:hypothetical protein
MPTPRCIRCTEVMLSQASQLPQVDRCCVIGLGARQRQLRVDEIKRRQLKALLIHLQRPSLLVPVPQHNALGRLVADLQLMDRRAVRMAVDQGAHAELLHYSRHFFRRDIDNVVGLHAHLGRAFAT